MVLGWTSISFKGFILIPNFDIPGDIQHMKNNGVHSWDCILLVNKVSTNVLNKHTF